MDADGVLTYSAPGVVMDGDDIGSRRWEQQNAGVQAQLMPKQRERLAKLGIPVTEPASPAPVQRRPRRRGRAGRRRRSSEVSQPSPLWVEQQGADRPVPRGAVVEITVDGEPEPVPVKLGVWISNTESRKDRLDADQLAALAKLGMNWA